MLQTQLYLAFFGRGTRRSPEAREHGSRDSTPEQYLEIFVRRNESPQKNQQAKDAAR
jgi:hypothetical protein